MAIYVLVLVTRGDADWSRPLTVAMYALVLGPFVLGLAGVAIASFGRMPRRDLVLALSILPILVAVGFGLMLIAVPGVD